MNVPQCWPFDWVWGREDLRRRDLIGCCLLSGDIWGTFLPGKREEEEEEEEGEKKKIKN